MCIVGYDDDLQAFDVRNSWGGYWGVGGYWWCGYDAAQDLADLNRFSAYYMTASYDSGAAEYFFDETPPPPDEYDESEPNNSLSTATALPGFDFSGFTAHCDAGDTADYFSFGYITGANTVITVYYTPAQLSPSVKLYNSGGSLLTTATGGNGQLVLSGVWSSSGTAIVEVLNQTAGTGGYAIDGYATTPPAQPTGVLATDGTNIDGVTVTWNAVASAASYTVQRANSAGGPFIDLGATFGTTVTDFNAAHWQEYWYRVLAVNGDGISIPSNPDSGYRGISAPSGISASDGAFADHIEITWNIDAPGTIYTLLRSVSPSGRYLNLGEFDSVPVSDEDIVTGVVYYYAVCCSHEGLLGPQSTPDTGYVSISGQSGNVSVHVDGQPGVFIDTGDITDGTANPVRSPSITKSDSKLPRFRWAAEMPPVFFE